MVEREFFYLAFWPGLLLILPLLPLPFPPVLLALLLAGIAQLILLKSRPPLHWRAKVVISVYWILALVALGYACLAWSAMVDAADVGLMDPGWTRGFLSAVAVIALSFAASAIQICRWSRQQGASRQAIDE